MRIIQSLRLFFAPTLSILSRNLLLRRIIQSLRSFFAPELSKSEFFSRCNRVTSTENIMPILRRNLLLPSVSHKNHSIPTLILSRNLLLPSVSHENHSIPTLILSRNRRRRFRRRIIQSLRSFFAPELSILRSGIVQ